MKRRITEIDRMTLWAKLSNSDKPARLVWSILGSQPRITVFTGNSNDKGFNGILSANMDPSVFFVFLESLREVATSEKETKRKIDFYIPKRNDSNGTVEQVLNSSLVYGKNSEGICWISLLEANKAKILFEFQPPEWNRFFKANGESYTKSELSIASCLGFIKAANGIYSNLIALNNYAQLNDMLGIIENQYNATYSKDEIVTGANIENSILNDELPF
jgi:hypothetical protein